MSILRSVPTTQVLIAGEYPVVRLGARHMLQGAPEIHIAGEAGSEADTLALLSGTGAGVVLLDASTPASARVLGWLHAMLAIAPACRILFFTGSMNPAALFPFFTAGARGAIELSADAGQLQAALRAVAAGQFWMGAAGAVDDWAGALAHSVPHRAGEGGEEPDAPGRRTFSLTPRELDMVRCIVEGCSNRDAARRFRISEETVKRHLSNVFDKTGVSTRLELALFALAHKLVTPEAA